MPSCRAPGSLLRWVKPPSPGNRNPYEPESEFFFEKAGPWQEAYGKLRRILLGCGLDEELKWGVPCYTHRGANIVLIHGFKEYCALLFHKGALLQDSEGILVQQTEHVQSSRQVRFTDASQIDPLEPCLRAYVHAAIEVETAGLKVRYRKTDEFDMPEELEEALDEDPELKEAFNSLTPGRQRGYLLHIGKAKQAKTRKSRIEKCRSKIFMGKGYNER